MKKIFFLLLMILIVGGCGGGQEESKDVQSTKHRNILTIGFDESFAPMGFRDENGEIVGFDVDLAKETAKRMGAEVEFRPIAWDKKEEEITSGNIDMIWNGLDIIDDYKEFMIFSKPYMDNRQILLVNAGNIHRIYSLSDLEGKVVATQAGSNAEAFINEHEDLKKSFAVFRTYHDLQEGFETLRKEHFYVLIIDEIAAHYEMNKHPGDFEIIEATVGPTTEFGIGFRKNDTELRDKVQKAFDSVVADGTAKQISMKWFQSDLIKLKKHY